VLIKPPPTLAGLQRISGPALVAMFAASLIAIVDGLAGESALLIGLLAIPPVIAAMSSSRPETAVVGALCVTLAAISATWNLGQEQLLQYLTTLVTAIVGALVGLWIASLRTNLRREQDASELLADAGVLMEEALDQKQRAEQLVGLAVPALGDVAMVDMLDSRGQIVRFAAKGLDPELAEAFVRLREESPIDPSGPHPVAEVIRTGRPQLLEQLSDEQLDAIASRSNERTLLRRHRFHSCIVFPLGARGSVLGSLTLWIMTANRGFDETARRTAKRLADRAALALDNARLHEQQAHIAGVLQHSLLPRSLPRMSGFEVASRFLAAGEAAYEVGGDFYDVFPSGGGTWNAVIGDVCGKGPEAAALTSLARYTIRTASSPETSPSEVLRTLHDSINAERSDLRFCTAALARIAPSNGADATGLTVSLGGHPLPLILRQDGSVERVGEPGSLLGALPSPALADVDAKLSVGDALVLYTDGMIEPRDRADGENPDWLERQLAGASGESAEQVAERLAAAAIERQGGEPRDDIAVLVLYRGGDG
jgi:serine phosphatase RsbU (regulator of sigma subunit)